MNENDRSVALPVQPAAGSLDSPEVRNAADVCHRQVRGYIVVILGSLVGVFAVGSFMAWAGVRISSLWTLAGALTAIGAVLLLVVLVPYAAMGFCVWRELTGTAMRFSEVTKGTILWLNLIGEPIVSVGVFFVSLVGMRTEGLLATQATSSWPYPRSFHWLPSPGSLKVWALLAQRGSAFGASTLSS
jgi:hypothetical protein